LASGPAQFLEFHHVGCWWYDIRSVCRISHDTATDGFGGAMVGLAFIYTWSLGLTLACRIFPFGITVGSLTLFFILIELILIAQNRLLPGVMMLGAFILLVLYLAGLIETAIQLFGAGNVSTNCQRYVTNNPISGVSASTLAWLEQNSICKSRHFPGDRKQLTNFLRLKLGRRIQLLDRRYRFLHLDVGHVFASEQGLVRSPSLRQLFLVFRFVPCILVVCIYAV